jgi:flagellar basal-body rod protein FlgC
MDLTTTLEIAASGMRAQGTRIRVVSENLANASSTAETPDGLPYRRQVVTFRNVFDRALGANTVDVAQIANDPSEFTRRYEPHHPSADEAGYVMYPNVNSLIEMMDLREAQRTYEANLGVLETSRSMLVSTIDVLRN